MVLVSPSEDVRLGDALELYFGAMGTFFCMICITNASAHVFGTITRLYSPNNA